MLILFAITIALWVISPHVDSAAAESELIDSGSCGDNAFWTLDSQGNLVITGNGEMDWPSNEHAPWNEYKSTITSVVVEEGITSIESTSFSHSYNLEKVILNEGLRNIGWNAFYACNKITEITIPDSVEIIDDDAFRQTGISEIYIGSNVRSIGECCFYWCQNLDNITVSTGNSNYRSIDGILYDKDITELIVCPSNKTGEVTIPNTVTSLGIGAFYGCNKITKLTMPIDLEVENNTFEGCTNVTDFTFTPGTTGISTDYTTQTYLSGSRIGWTPWYNSEASNIRVTINNGVKSIGDYMFYHCRNLTSISLPDGLESIGIEAFMECDSLHNVSIPQSIKEVGRSAFVNGNIECLTMPIDIDLSNDPFYCESLNEVHIIRGNSGIEPDSYNRIQLPWYYSQSDSIDIYVESGIKTIGSQMFAYISANSVRVQLPSGLETINDGAFTNTNITEISIPDSVESIGNYAFNGCQILENVSFPSSLNSLGEYSFAECINLKTIELRNIITIGNSAFENCSSLNRAIFPDSLKSIGTRALYGCEGLDYLSIPIDVSLVNVLNMSVSNVTLTKGSTGIGYEYEEPEDIGWNTNREPIQLTLAEGVKTLGQNTFGDAHVQTITMSDTVEEIKLNAYSPRHNYGTTQFNLESIKYSSGLVVMDPNISEYYDQDGNRLANSVENIRGCVFELVSGKYVRQTDTDSYFELKINVNDSEYGSVSGEGIYKYGDKANIIATASEGYIFLRWSDGDTNPSREVTVTSNLYLTAYFAREVTVNIICSPDGSGTTIGSGSYASGSTITLSAIPAEGFQFASWSTGSTDQETTYVVYDNITIIAYFEEADVESNGSTILIIVIALIIIVAIAGTVLMHVRKK